ncbi:hypothetical protein E2562_036514 [Oryza meyeriana var. granulata]|uniref:Uncharacterized protein n=1 Tax=Oryza meyeriana var. granulata TaxID=110450 RepID=A0A6G1FGC1_9ORYZ|nr:hypothetical protein E2562_036514 [Oryza meyeriana var. granulata]
MEAGGYYNCKKTDGICEDVCDSEVSEQPLRPSAMPCPRGQPSDLSLSLPRRVFLSVAWFKVSFEYVEAEVRTSGI